MSIALLTTYLAPYRVPLFERLADRHDLEVLCFGGAERYVPPWFADLDAQLAAASFPAGKISSVAQALSAGRDHETVIAPFAGGAMLPAAYAGARMNDRRFVLWASVWAHPRSLTHGAARPVIRGIYKNADSVVAYGEHVRSFVKRIRGRDDDVFIAPQAVERELFERPVSGEELRRFRARHGIASGPIALYVGRMVAEKGVEVLLESWRLLGPKATLVFAGDGPLASAAGATPGTRTLGALPREELPVAYAASAFALLPSIPTPRFREPWGLVCNEAMHQARPMIASDAVGAVAGGLVRENENGLVVHAGDAAELADAIERLLGDDRLRERLGHAARESVRPYTYDAMVEAFERALTAAHRTPT